MAKYLILSDIHNRINAAQRIIDTVSHDTCILLGDYFDSYYDLPEDAKNTAIWLKEKVLYNPNIIPLFGNHCASYIFNHNIHIRCSGYTDEKNIAINKILNDDDKSRFKVYAVADGYVCTHAGLTNPLWKNFSSKFEQRENETKLKFFERVLSKYVDDNVSEAKNNKVPELFSAGWERGGYQQHGGVNWVDWDSFSPINGINQIVGHTIHSSPQVCIQYAGGGIKKKDVSEYYLSDTNDEKQHLSISYGLDTASRHYMVIEDGVVDIFHIETGISLKNVKNIYLPENPMSGL